ncbi:MAG: PQQ-dependent sugar dehydrogenase [Candidatus Levybacteria bacterium]|nr:PQQ-dependent sugar dehydrogenase [Candidatus Levybacteria bacterium]
MKKRILIIITACIILLTALFFILKNNAKDFRTNQSNKTQQEKTAVDRDIPLTTVIAKNLDVPWAIAFLNDGSMLVTERAGNVKLINPANGKQTVIAKIDDAKEIGEGGLLGIVLHPNFKTNHFVYVYYTYDVRGNRAQNRVIRYTFDGQSFNNKTVIVDDIPSAPNHNGGRIKFGPDGLLYITTGDAQNPSFAQDAKVLAGKILRLTDEGKPAPDNPFNNAVYSYGHRNPQGLTWDNNGNLWETEHGQNATDELNLIEIGKNYGWPTIRGTQAKNGMITPVIQSGSDTWAPSGAAYLNGSIYFSGLRGNALYQAVLNSTSVKELKTHFKKEFGRIREVIVGPDNMLYITTSNRDGRGIPGFDDDRIIRVNPQKL